MHGVAFLPHKGGPALERRGEQLPAMAQPQANHPGDLWRWRLSKETYVPPLIRPSGTFSHREKALTTPSLSTGRERPKRRVRDRHLSRGSLGEAGHGTRRRRRGDAFLGLGSRGSSLQDLLDETRVHGVTRLVRRDLAHDGTTDQGQIADEVEDLVPDELVAETERPVHHTLVVEDDAVLYGTAAGETCLTQFLNFLEEAERTRRSDLAEEAVVVKVEVEGLFADGAVREVDPVLQDQAVRGDDADRLLAVDDLDRLVNAEDFNVAVQLPYAGGVDEVHERNRAAVNDGNLGAVDPNVDVGNAAGHDRRQQVLNRADGDVVLPDSRGVVEGRGGCLQRGYPQSIQVGADEGNATSRLGWLKLESCVDS